jgi:hypothetical protein
MSNSPTITLPTGQKIELRSFSAKGKQPGAKGKSGHALLHPDTNKYNGFGVVAPAAAAHLPTFVTIDGLRVELTQDTSNAGHPRVKAPASTTLADGRRVVCRMVDNEDGTWNYVLEVLPPGKTGGGARRPASASIFASA